MYSICILTVLACFISLVLTPYVQRWSARAGLLDRPDEKRKLHSAATPRSGGIVILVAYVGAFALLVLFPLSAGGIIQGHFDAVRRLIPPVAVVFATGLLDDRFGLRPWQKLVGQAIASIWAYGAGLSINGIDGFEVAPWGAFVLTVGWLMLCSNAFNLIDGMDGLAAGVGLTATVTTLAFGMLQGDFTLGLATAPLAGALLGFLRYNFAPASIFLGDSGSLLIGFLLGSYSIIWSQKSATMLGVTVPMMVLALPLLEVGLSIVRRFLRNEPIFAADRGHIHHRLLDRGFSPRRAALMLYAVCGLGAALSLLGSVSRNRFALAVILLFGAVLWVGVRYLGYIEFDATRQFLCGGVRPLISAHIHLRALESSLEQAATVEAIWHSLDRAGHSLGYSHLTAQLGGQRFHTAPDRSHDTTFWQMRLNLPDDDFVNITQRQGSTDNPVLVIPFVHVLQRILPDKLAAFRANAGCLDAFAGIATRFPDLGEQTRAAGTLRGRPPVNVAAAS